MLKAPAYCLNSQLFVTPQLPAHDFSGQTIIITGSNTGLGLETARHLLSLHCSHLILAVRNTSKGEEAKKSLLSSSPSPTAPPPDPSSSPSSPPQINIEIWPLDLSVLSSVRAFAHRARTTLSRLDVLISNAGVDAGKFALSPDGWETTLQTNVISTCLLSVLMLPKLRESGERFQTVPHLVVVTSETHFFARFPDWDAGEGGILKALNGQESYGEFERYVILIAWCKLDP